MKSKWILHWLEEFIAASTLFLGRLSILSCVITSLQVGATL